MKILLKNSIIITDKKHINGDKMLNFVIDFISLICYNYVIDITIDNNDKR